MEPADPELRQAARAMQEMTQRSFLNRSCFRVAYPDGSATDFVDYLFSPLGAAEWPPRDARPQPGEELSADEAMMREAMAYEAEQARFAGMAVLPGSVKISRLRRTDTAAKELVLSTGPNKGMVIARGFLPGEDEPVLEREWKLAAASPDQAVRQMCESNIEMGVRMRP